MIRGEKLSDRAPSLLEETQAKNGWPISGAPANMRHNAARHRRLKRDAHKSKKGLNGDCSAHVNKV